MALFLRIQQLRLYGFPYLINDQRIGGRQVEADTSGLNQLTAMLPITYQANSPGGGIPIDQSPGSSLYVGETAISTFYATNSGWYRIMVPYGIGRGDMDGRVSIISTFAAESIEMQVDCTPGAIPLLNVLRCKPASSGVVTQARAVTYFDYTLGGVWSFLDIYVGNPIPASQGMAARLTVTLDTEGMQRPQGLACQLLSPVLPVSATLPSGNLILYQHC